MNDKKDMREFYVTTYIDICPPDVLGAAEDMSGETIMSVCAAVAGTVGARLIKSGIDVTCSHGFSVGRERFRVDEALRSTIESNEVEAYKFKIPPYEPSAADKAPDATMLPPQANSDLRVLVWTFVSVAIDPGPHGQALFRAAAALEGLVNGFSYQEQENVMIIQVDVEPGAEEDKEAMRQFMDSCI